MSSAPFADGDPGAGYMADSKFTKSQERAFHKLKKAINDSEDVVYATAPRKER